MSFEETIAAHTAALKENTAAIVANTELLKEAAAGREKVLAAAQAAGATAAAPKSGGRKGAADKETPPADPKPPVDEYAGEGGAEKLRGVCAEYLQIEDEAERTARKPKVSAVFGKYGAKKWDEVPADKRSAVVAEVRALIEAGNVLKPAPAEDDLLG